MWTNLLLPQESSEEEETSLFQVSDRSVSPNPQILPYSNTVMSNAVL